MTAERAIRPGGRVVYLSAIPGFLVAFFASGAMAGLVLTPLLGPSLGSSLRPADDFAGVPYLLDGFILMAFAVAFTLWRLPVDVESRAASVRFALCVWAMVTANYLIVAGWSTIPGAPMLAAGILSGVGPFLGALVTAAVQRRMQAGASRAAAPAQSGV